MLSQAVLDLPRPDWPVPHAGMPPMGDGPPLSRFEFWPMWRFYPPVAAWALLMALRHRGLRLPLLANPLLPAGGLVGESKSQVLDLIGGEARSFVAPYTRLVRGAGPVEDEVARALAAMRRAGLGLPVVAKPDLGCRGAGVRPIRSRADLGAYLAAFPAGEALLLQQLIDVEGEAGIFYVRVPGERQGRIFSLTLKYFPYVVADGRRTLRELILADPRAGQVPGLYLPRHQDRLATTPPRGEPVRLAFAGSHSRGAIFRDGTDMVTEALRARFDAIAAAISEFWFGRFDIRFADFEEVRRGRGFKIVECNGAGAEATHIWDARVRLRDAYRTLARQYSLLWKIGAANRRRGFRPESWRAFLARRRREHAATLRYPPTA